MTLVEISVVEGVDREQALRLVGALEHGSEHPIAQAIAIAAAARGVLPAVESFTNREGLGVEGIVAGHALIVGRPALLADWAIYLSPELDAARRGAEARGQTASPPAGTAKPPPCSPSPTPSRTAPLRRSRR
jgi:Cu+-exporting ATPase